MAAEDAEKTATSLNRKVCLSLIAKIPTLTSQRTRG